MLSAITQARILTPAGFISGQSLIVSGSLIKDIIPDQDIPDTISRRYDAKGQTLLPGLIDLQVNGGGGVLLNDAPTVETIKTMGQAHRAFGTTAFLPTLISDDFDVMSAAIDAVDQAITRGVPGVIGIHLEGPFLNPAKKGVHDASKFGQIGADDIALLSRLTSGKTLVTLAPERTDPDIIRKLSRLGIVISAGHSEAGYKKTLESIEAGLTGFTHLFNAMPQLTSRAPGMIAAALEDPRAWCGIIADGHHVHPAMLRLALRAKREEQIFLVTDAMPSVGAAHKDFALGPVSVTVRDGKCITKDGTLAGSDLDMISAVRNARDMLHLPLEQAVRMGSIVPAKFMGLQNQMGELRKGLRANMILVDDNLKVIESWINGHPDIS